MSGFLEESPVTIRSLSYLWTPLCSCFGKSICDGKGKGINSLLLFSWCSCYCLFPWACFPVVILKGSLFTYKSIFKTSLTLKRLKVLLICFCFHLCFVCIYLVIWCIYVYLCIHKCVCAHVCEQTCHFTHVEVEEKLPGDSGDKTQVISGKCFSILSVPTLLFFKAKLSYNVEDWIQHLTLEPYIF